MHDQKAASLRTRKLTFSSMFLAIALALPFLTGQIPQIGAALSPMHIPVLMCGFVCGWPYGLAVGLIAPVLRSVLFGMPRLFPSAVAMTFELAAYGAFAGLLYRMFPKKPWAVYAALILSMIIGRLVWGAAQYFLLQMQGSRLTMEIFLSGAVITALPGIILHIILIPPLVLLFRKAGLIGEG